MQRNMLQVKIRFPVLKLAAEENRMFSSHVAEASRVVSAPKAHKSAMLFSSVPQKVEDLKHADADEVMRRGKVVAGKQGCAAF